MRGMAMSFLTKKPQLVQCSSLPPRYRSIGHGMKRNQLFSRNRNELKGGVDSQVDETLRTLKLKFNKNFVCGNF